MIDLYNMIDIEISDDQMKAELKQSAPFPEGVSKDDILKFLRESGIVFGIHEERIDALIKGVNKTPLTIAEGVKPQNGKDGYIWSMLDEDDSEFTDEQLESKQMVDLKQVIQIPSVTKGEVVGRKINPTDAIPGTNIAGEEVKGRNGKEVVLRQGKNTKLQDEGATLVANIDGQVSVEPRVIHVYPVFEVHGDVNMRTGNIDFVGNVNIRGSVPSGFEIKAKGDIRVHGSVEAAHLEAGGSIYIHQGVVAQGGGLIAAESELVTSFLNQANVKAGGNVTVTKSILHSKVETDGVLNCFDRNGSICGGSVSAVAGLDANEIGNEMNTPTSVYVGVSQSILEKEKANKKLKAEAEDNLQKLGVLLKKLVNKEKENALSAQEKVTKLRIRKSFAEAHENLNIAQSGLDSVSEIIEAVDPIKVKVRKTVYPQVDIHFGKYRKRITTKHKGVSFFLDKSEIRFEPL
ncbi:DUF342 domain-containing protein [Salisediminibacterium beveridgei]|uniref:Flagellar Assembly Protein A N-terminal region domain-containing protein n=1 Tax=Salisediminibacterium beveridgei TaxID=632773 RepID=A0A1D7QVX1_9BACI|nr:FapA family protein [Salisediminibacterium beveridgei]AOM83160.1 hypothetical protein BBEV_1799 [Salisediminibacterium beveridgei]